MSLPKHLVHVIMSLYIPPHYNYVPNSNDEISACVSFDSQTDRYADVWLNKSHIRFYIT